MEKRAGVKGAKTGAEQQSAFGRESTACMSWQVAAEMVLGGRGKRRGKQNGAEESEGTESRREKEGERGRVGRPKGRRHARGSWWVLGGSCV